MQILETCSGTSSSRFILQCACTAIVRIVPLLMASANALAIRIARGRPAVREAAKRGGGKGSSAPGPMFHYWSYIWWGETIAVALISFIIIVAVFACIGVYARRVWSLPTHSPKSSRD